MKFEESGVDVEGLRRAVGCEKEGREMVEL